MRTAIVEHRNPEPEPLWKRGGLNLIAAAFLTGETVAFLPIGAWSAVAVSAPIAALNWAIWWSLR